MNRGNHHRFGQSPSRHDFARALRAFLRQDPDKIMVGEIRDIGQPRLQRASLTSHVVLATHPKRPRLMTRLVDMGLEPFLYPS